MKAIFKRLFKFEKGQALPIVLGVLAIGGLTIVPMLNYARTSLNTNQIMDEKQKGLYAAAAGIEHNIWSIKTETTPSTNLTESINGMTVNMSTPINEGTYTLWSGGLSEPREQYWKISIQSNVTYDSTNRYKYEIVIALNAEVTQTVFLDEIGARLPVGYTYDNTLTRNDGLATHAPDTSYDGQGAELLNWRWKDWGARPRLDNVGDNFTQTFYFTGTGDVDGYYAWLVAQPDIIDVVGEFSGTWYKLHAMASRASDNKTMGEITADIMKSNASGIQVLSWKIEQ